MYAQSIAILCFLFLLPALQAQQPPTQYVGEVIIVGNETLSDAIIRNEVTFYPGAVLRDEDLRLAERNLIQTGRFVVDMENGIAPTVTIIENPGPFKDILIRVQEKPRFDRPTTFTIVASGALIGGICVVLMTWWLCRAVRRRRAKLMAIQHSVSS